MLPLREHAVQGARAERDAIARQARIVHLRPTHLRRRLDDDAIDAAGLEQIIYQVRVVRAAVVADGDPRDALQSAVEQRPLHQVRHLRRTIIPLLCEMSHM